MSSAEDVSCARAETQFPVIAGQHAEDAAKLTAPGSRNIDHFFFFIETSHVRHLRYQLPTVDSPALNVVYP